MLEFPMNLLTTGQSVVTFSPDLTRIPVVRPRADQPWFEWSHSLVTALNRVTFDQPWSVIYIGHDHRTLPEDRR